MQLSGSAKGSGPEPQRVPLGPSPGAPFDDYRETERKQLLSKFPLQGFNLSSTFFLVEAKGKSLEPIVRREANRAESTLKRLGKGRFT